MKDELKILLAYMILIGIIYFIENRISSFLFSNKPYRNLSKHRMSKEEACKILGIKPRHLKKMSMSDLKSIYRKKAMEVHPDQSGKDGSEFRDVNNAWSELKSYAFA